MLHFKCSLLLRWVVIWVPFLLLAVDLCPVFETFLTLWDLLKTSDYVQKLPGGWRKTWFPLESSLKRKDAKECPSLNVHGGRPLAPALSDYINHFLSVQFLPFVALDASWRLTIPSSGNRLRRMQEGSIKSVGTGVWPWSWVTWIVSPFYPLCSGRCFSSFFFVAVVILMDMMYFIFVLLLLNSWKSKILYYIWWIIGKLKSIITPGAYHGDY